MIEIKNLCFKYNKEYVLENLSVDFNFNEITSILGANGSGKTTLIKCIERLLIPTKGTIYLNNKNSTDYSRKELSQIITSVPQRYKENFAFSVFDFVSLGRNPLLKNNEPEKKDTEIVLSVLEKLNLIDYKNQIYTQLSGGQLQLCLIARALVAETKILLLDEPISHLDFNYQQKIFEILTQIMKEKKLTIIMTIHEPNIASVFSHKLLLLHDKNVYKYNKPCEIISEENIYKIYDINLNIIKFKSYSFVLPLKKY